MKWVESCAGCGHGKSSHAGSTEGGRHGLCIANHYGVGDEPPCTCGGFRLRIVPSFATNRPKKADQQ